MTTKSIDPELLEKTRQTMAEMGSKLMNLANERAIAGGGNYAGESMFLLSKLTEAVVGVLCQGDIAKVEDIMVAFASEVREGVQKGYDSGALGAVQKH